MIQHFVVRLQSRFLSRSSGLWDRFSRETLRQRLQKATETQRTNRTGVYYPDVIPLRPPRDLWKAGAFAAGVSIGAFTLAAVWDEKKRRKFHEEAELIVRRFYQQAERMVSPDAEPELEFSPGMKCALFLVLANCTVTVLWKIPQLRAFMWRYFSNSYASRSLCSPMLLSAFSHSSLLHLGINMYVLWTFASVSIDKFLGVPQFCAMYASASVVSSLASLMHKSAIRSPIRALGASGAILGLLAYTCCKIPEARLQIVFLPFFDFSAQSAIIGVILFDLAGLLFGFKLFDHAAHLGGALFGVAYAQYGEKLWKRYSPTIGKWLN